ncbi:MAG: M20/M25/M40 family metallo-hydrolase [Pirellulales bacterium]|nr:M20/M25/M40 family metallo-hydrolase [Pirellulales bacterium]
MIDSLEIRARELLCDLIALPTVNPMGKPFRGALPIERPVIEYLEQLFAPYGVQLQRLPCSPLHESLLITVDGQTDLPGTLLESHIDTVPADDWLEQALKPRVAGGQIFGRGACDDKGSLVGMVLALLSLLESGNVPPQCVWLLAAGDEEYAQCGIRQFLASQNLPIGRAIFGEPTELVPVIQHKGTIRWDITVLGRSAHTSRAELGRSAILDAMHVIELLAKHQQELRAMHTNPLVSGPSLTVTMIEGGRTRNMVPDRCTMAVDFRIVPGMDPQRAIDDLFERLAASGLSLEHGDFQCFAPALSTAADDPFVRRIAAICQRILHRPVAPTGAPYGSDAGWMPKKIPALVLGPGSIDQAHAIDEFIELNQVVQMAAICRDTIVYDWHHPSRDLL